MKYKVKRIANLYINGRVIASLIVCEKKRKKLNFVLQCLEMAYIFFQVTYQHSHDKRLGVYFSVYLIIYSMERNVRTCPSI